MPGRHASDSDFAPIERLDGHLPLEDYGLIGDGASAALVGRDGTIAWLCVPRFDSAPLFCSLLDARANRGGGFRVTVENLQDARQRYLDDTGVLVTELRSPTGVLEITDAMTLHEGANLRADAPAARGELVRILRVVEGRVRIHMEVQPRGGAEIERADGALRLRCPAHPDLDLNLATDAALTGLAGSVDAVAGEERFLMLRWGGGSARPRRADARRLIEHTASAWRRWMRTFNYEGPQRALVRRSAVTLKLLDHFENGAIVAAPTSSLPEEIGGVRNWDYRYAWIRDAAFSVYALRRIGFAHEAWGFLAWVLEASERHSRPCVLYDLDGDLPPTEREDPELTGYRGSRPVRWGNAAAAQRQHDVFGEILDCAWQWAAGGRGLDEVLLDRLEQVIDAASNEWRTPDHGIWEARTTGHAYTYSAALCQVALDRGARLFERFRPGCAKRQHWQRQAQRIRQVISQDAWSERLGALAARLDGGGGLDASLLALPLRRVIGFEHPRMVATTGRIGEHLDAGNGLLYRYRPDESPDGLPGHEGAFVICSFWLVDNLAGQGRLDDAQALFDSLCARTNALGLLAEQIDPVSGRFLGNYPQAFSHVGLVSSAVNLARRHAARGAAGATHGRAAPV